VSSFLWQPIDIAKLAQKAENKFVGVNCGIMDQMAVACCQKNHALFIDCKTLETKQIPIPSEFVLIIMDTSTRRTLVDSQYNERRNSCEEAARYLSLPSLRYLQNEDLKKLELHANPLILKRARHVMTENERVLKAIQALKENKIKILGQLMNESHQSLDQDYEVTNSALNAMVECAQETRGCLGARMTGAGFGGCTIALVEKEKADEFILAVEKNYFKKTNLKGKFYKTKAMEGTDVLRPFQNSK